MQQYKITIMGEAAYGIHEQKLGALSMEVLDYTERISNILKRIDASMDQLPGCYQGSPCAALINRYRALRAQYPVLKNNLKSYSEDFIALTRKVLRNDVDLSTMVKRFTNDLPDQVGIDKFTLKRGE